MSSNIYNNEKDRTMTRGGGGPGMLMARHCWKCRLPKLQTGGGINKRTRMWECAACKAPK